MHDAHLGRAFLFLDILAEYTLLSMTVMVTPCLKHVVGMKLVMFYAKFPQAPFARAPFGECRFSLPGNKAIVCRNWSDFLTELHRRSGETFKTASGENFPKMRISVAFLLLCRGRTRPELF